MSAMETILRVCLLIGSMTGYLLLFTHKFHVRIQFAPALYCAWTSHLLFLAGCLQILPQTVWIWLAGGIFLLAAAFRRNWRPDRHSLIVYGAFVCVLVWFFFLLQGAHMTSYDNFSHWATVVKDMLRENRLPDSQDALIRFQSYPLGSSLFIYGICTVTGAAEGIMLWAQVCMDISFLFCLFVFVQKTNWYLTVVPVLYGLWALTVNNSIYELRVDTLLPLCGTAAFAMIYAYRKEPVKASDCAAGMWMLLLQIKNSGIFFYLVCLLFFLLYERKALLQLKLRFFCGGILAPVLTLFLWKGHVATAFSDGMSSKHSMNLAHFEEMAAKKSADDIREIGLHILSRFGDPASIEVKMALLLTVFLFVVAVLCYRSGQAKKIVWLLVSCLGCLALYTLSLYAMYVFSMPMAESARLASYDRYMLSVLIFICGIAAVVVTEISSRCTKTSLLRMLCAVQLLFVILLTGHAAKKLPLLYKQPDFAKSKRSQLQQMIRENGITEGQSCLIYCNRSDDDARYFFYLTRYELWSDEILVVQPEEWKEKASALTDYDVLMVWDPDEDIKTYLNKHPEIRSIVRDT